MFAFKCHSRREVSLPLGSLARVPCRQPQEGFFPFLLASLLDLSEERRGGEEGSKSRVKLWVRFCPSWGSAHPPRGDWSPHRGLGLGHLARSPCPSWALLTERGTRANVAPLGARGPLPSRGRAWSDPRVRAARGPRLTPGPLSRTRERRHGSVRTDTSPRPTTGGGGQPAPPCPRARGPSGHGLQSCCLYIPLAATASVTVLSVTRGTDKCHLSSSA